MSGIASHTATESDELRHKTRSLGLLVGTCLCLVLTLGFAVRTLRHPATNSPPYEGERINPNDAPAASLMRLPGLGPTRARALVAYRDGFPGPQPAFADPAGLQQVKGIGPGIAEAIRPWLQFPTPPEQDRQGAAGI